MELYGLPTGKGYEVESKLIRDGYMQGRTGDITLTGADGQTYIGEIVPYLFLATEYQMPLDNPRLPIDLSTGIWEDTPVELTFGTIRITDMERLEADDNNIIVGKSP